MIDVRYLREFSTKGFWDKVGGYAQVAGEELIEKALLLWYVLRKPDVPAWAKTAIMGALGYFIYPLDVVPDVAPIVGYVDDLSVIALALATVSVYIDDEVRDQASKKLRDWFGPKASSTVN